MKKAIFTLSILLSVGNMVNAQKVEIGERNDYIRYESSMLGMDDNYYYTLVGYNYDKENHRGATLYTYDKNMKIVDKTHIDGDMRMLATESFVTNDKIAIVYENQLFSNMTCEVIDKNTKKSIRKKEYFFDNTDFHETPMLLTCTSADDSLFFAMKTIYNTKKNEIKSSKMILFDNELNELWTKDYFVPVAATWLSNDGEFVTGGYFEDKSGVQNIKLSIVTGEDEVEFETSISDFVIADMEIANYSNGEILVYGLIEGKREFLQKRNYTYYTGFYSFVYDTKTKTMGKVNKYTFTEDDYKILDNINASRKNNDKNTTFLKALKVLPTADGGAVVSYEVNYTITVKDQYGFKSSYKATGGVLLWCLNDDGSVVWHNGFRKMMYTGMFENSWYLPHYLTANEEVIFITENSKKDKAGPNLAVNYVGKRYAKENQKCPGKLPDVLTMVRFDKNGNVSKEVIHTDKKMLLVGDPTTVDNGKAIILYVSTKKAPGGLIRIDVK